RIPDVAGKGWRRSSPPESAGTALHSESRRVSTHPATPPGPSPAACASSAPSPPPWTSPTASSAPRFHGRRGFGSGQLRRGAGDHLLRQGQVAIGADRENVVHHDRLSEAGRFRNTHVSRDGGAVHLRAEVLLRLLRDLARQVQPAIVHGQEDAFDLKRWIEVALYDPHCVEELRKTLQCVELTL